MRVKFKHDWRPDYQEAIKIQKKLIKKLVLDVNLDKLEFIAGTDSSYEIRGKKIYAGVLVYKYPELKIVERSFAVKTLDYPYIPGLLSFREGPALIEAFEKLKTEPDIIIFDGQGIAHPRGIGLAAHLGVVLDKPSIGCAKTCLVGEYKLPGMSAGQATPLVYNDKVLGAVVRTRDSVKPVFISCGHKINLDQAVRIVLSTCRGFRLPEPIRQAHMYVNKLRCNPDL